MSVQKLVGLGLAAIGGYLFVSKEVIEITGASDQDGKKPPLKKEEKEVKNEVDKPDA